MFYKFIIKIRDLSPMKQLILALLFLGLTSCVEYIPNWYHLIMSRF